jgi:hypothetical protein
MTITTTPANLADSQILPIEFVATNDYAYEPDAEEYEYYEYAPILEAIGAGENDWITVFEMYGDGTNAELIIGVSGQSDNFFKVSCSMTSKIFEFLCIDFISSTTVTPLSIERINGYRVRLGLVPWTLETAYADYFGYR